MGSAGASPSRIPALTTALDAGLTDGRGDGRADGGGSVTVLGDVVHNGAAIDTGPGGWTVFAAGSTARGAGLYTGPGTVAVRGGLRPGNSPAIITYGGDLVLGSTAHLEIEIGGLNPGTQHDQVQVAGTAYLDGTLDVQLINGFVPTAGQSFTFMTFGARWGDFAQFTGMNLPNGLTFQPVVTSTTYSLTAVPMPAGVLACCAAAAGLGLWRRRRH